MAKKNVDKKIPACFGKLETVFPKGKNGLRNTPETCFACRHKTECLRSAIDGVGGLKIREEFVDRAYTSGTMGFMERWSKKKEIKRRLEKKIKGSR
ncbi:MAG: hypothetical protein JRC89_14465 [Deltaproteobacteria bacterium]|nr:hypothetical protein [Deltaproteobacteria bacterium]